MPFKNEEDGKKYRHEYYLKNKEKIKKRSKNWIKNNPEKRKKIVKKNNDKSKKRKREWHENEFYDGNATIIEKKCYFCKTNKSLNIHHIDGKGSYNSNHPNNESKNLVILCNSCHRKVHILISKYIQGNNELFSTETNFK